MNYTPFSLGLDQLENHVSLPTTTYKPISLDENGQSQWDQPPMNGNDTQQAPPVESQEPEKVHDNSCWKTSLQMQMESLMGGGNPKQHEVDRLNLQFGVVKLPETFKSNNVKEVKVVFDSAYPSFIEPIVITSVNAQGTSPDAVYTATISQINEKGFTAVIQLITTYKSDFEDDVKLVWRAQAPSDMAKIVKVGSYSRSSDKDPQFKLHHLLLSENNVSSKTHAIFVQAYSMSDLSFVTTVFESIEEDSDYDNSILNVYIERISDSHKHWNVDVKLAYIILPLYNDAYGHSEVNAIGSNELAVPTVVKKISSKDAMLFDQNAILLSSIIQGNPFGMLCNLRRIDQERGHFIFALQKYVSKPKKNGWKDTIVICSMINCEPCVAPELDVISEMSSISSLNGNHPSLNSDISSLTSNPSLSSQSSTPHPTPTHAEQLPSYQNYQQQQQQQLQPVYKRTSYQQSTYQPQPGPSFQLQSQPPSYQHQQGNSQPQRPSYQHQPQPPSYQHQQGNSQQSTSGQYYPTISQFQAPSPYVSQPSSQRATYQPPSHQHQPPPNYPSKQQTQHYQPQYHPPSHRQQHQQQQQQQPQTGYGLQNQQSAKYMQVYRDYRSLLNSLHTLPVDNRFQTIISSIDFMLISLGEMTNFLRLLPSERDYRSLFDRVCHRVKKPPSISEMISCLHMFSGEHDRVHLLEFFFHSSPPPPSHKILSTEASAYLSTLVLPSSKLHVLEFLAPRIKDKKKAIGVVEQFEIKTDKKKAKKLLNWWF